MKPLRSMLRNTASGHPLCTYGREVRRMVASLHFIRTALLDRDAPFHRR
jgi:hypothetical protein